MKNKLIGLILFSLSCLPCWADKDLKYGVYEDWAKLGYVQVHDTGDNSMSFEAACNSVFYAKNLKRMLMTMGWILDRVNESDGISQITTDWKQKNTSGFGAFLSGVDSVRTKIVVVVSPCGSPTGFGDWTKIDMQLLVEMAKEGGTWHQTSDRELRNQIRGFIAATLMRPIYGDTDQVRNLVVGTDAPLPTKEEFRAKFIGTDPFVAPQTPATPAPAPLFPNEPRNPEPTSPGGQTGGMQTGAGTWGKHFEGH